MCSLRYLWHCSKAWQFSFEASFPIESRKHFRSSNRRTRANGMATWDFPELESSLSLIVERFVLSPSNNSRFLDWKFKQIVFSMVTSKSPTEMSVPKIVAEIVHSSWNSCSPPDIFSRIFPKSGFSSWFCRNSVDKAEQTVIIINWQLWRIKQFF